jgi:signal transduction histidine kinase
MTAAAEVLASRRSELSERSQQALDLLIAQVRRFDAMVIDLLELSRLEAGAIDGHLEEVDIGNLSGRIIARSSTPSTRLSLKSSTPIIAVTDRVRFERILSNLVENAHIHAGGATEVSISTQRIGDIVLTVDDAGRGVDEHDRVRIFERFTRGSAARAREGTGLGLALVAEHAAALDGWTYVDDSPAGGARFVVVLPKAEPTLIAHDMPTGVS